MLPAHVLVDAVVPLTPEGEGSYIEAMPVSFSVATYNILASAYAHRGWYPRTPAIVLRPEWRIPALARHVAGLKADLLCLQEVEPDLLARLRAELAVSGYDVHYARNAGRRPDGLAMFYRKEAFITVSASRLVFTDGDGAAPDSGCIALIALFRVEERLLGVINTHLLWDPPGSSLTAQRGYRQARQLLAEYRKLENSAAAWILAGDLNVTPESALVAMMRGAGLDYAHRRLSVATCNVKGEARMIDYLYHSTALCSEPDAPAPIDDRTILPSAEQPSDHVPLMARFTWLD
jgi:mRNA deadenylase 3'-5' endonuclease subunit Ccr4